MAHSRRSSTSYNENDAPLHSTPTAPMKSHPDFGTVLHRLQTLSTADRAPLSPLGPPFALVDPSPRDKSAAASNFAPRPASSFDLSPQSSSSSSCSDFSSVASSRPDVFDAFVRTQSRVVKLFNLPPMPQAFLASVFAQNNLAPVSMWAQERDLVVLAVFQTHTEACAALSLSSSRFSVVAALESDLDPRTNSNRIDLVPNVIAPQLYMNNALPTQRVAVHGAGGASILPEEYTLSSNPPNPRTSFRLGDWICRAQNCAAHNFGRNLACIGCGCPRSPTAHGSAAAPDAPHHHGFPAPPSRPQLSPRFATAANSMHSPPNLSPTSYGFPPQPSPTLPRPQQQAQQPTVNLPLSSQLAALNKAAMSGYPLLTPSGRAFAIGGKVQNVSSDPLSPCIMYWPDNEPFPEQGQIRPSNLMAVPQPPILNTGNRGPISHQPGDWICLKCNYLNWRRRKVCQTCLPYAEGNGDSISAAVQAERIALLTSVLTHTRLASPDVPPALAAASVPSHPHSQAIGIGRSHSTTPAQAHRPFVNFSPPPLPARGPVHRSQSHNELGSQFAHGHPIYQTSPHSLQQHYPHLPSPLQRHSSAGNPVNMHAPAPAPLLPSFLQDIVQSPTLSPASTSSADLSFEEYEESLPSSTRSTFSHSGADSVNASPLANIWRLDGDESKSIAATSFPLPTRRDRGLMGSATSSRNSSVERLRMHVPSS